MQDFWNQRYANNETVYGLTPNDYFKKNLERLEPNNILLPAEGEGRNAVYAASLGWQVTAFDYSIEAKNKATALAKSKAVEIIYKTSDINHFVIEQSYAAIGLIFVHLPSNERKTFHHKMIDALAPGGVIIMEAFAKAQINNTSGGPKTVDQLYSVEELKEDFAELDIIELKEKLVELDEGSFHKGKANVIRLFAKK